MNLGNSCVLLPSCVVGATDVVKLNLVARAQRGPRYAGYIAEAKLRVMIEDLNGGEDRDSVYD